LTLHGVSSIMCGGPASGSGRPVGLDDIMDALKMKEREQQLLILLQDL
jgi:hypothetical protein